MTCGAAEVRIGNSKGMEQIGAGGDLKEREGGGTMAVRWRAMGGDGGRRRREGWERIFLREGDRSGEGIGVVFCEYGSRRI